MKTIDLAGQRYGRLTVIEKHSIVKGRVLYLCKCDCGNITIKAGYNLKRGHTLSCGCLQREVKATKKKHNIYEKGESYCVGYTEKGTKFLFDTDDWDLVTSYYWREGSNGYIIACGNSWRIQLHRLLMGFPDNMVVDHVNGDITDNRKANLRVCTQHDNSMNCKISKNNTSGCTGVVWNKGKKKWTAQICYNYKTYCLGHFNKFDDAVKARKEAEEKYFGKYAKNQEVAI